MTGRRLTPRPAAWLLTAILGSLAVPWTAAAQGSYSGSMVFARGRETDGIRTDATYVFNTVEVAAGRLRAGVTVPIVALRTSWPVDAAATSTIAETSAGIGDLFVRGELSLTGRDLRAWSASVSGGVSLPTGDEERGLGSGAVDATFGVTLSGVRGRQSWLADVSYWALGDPADVEVRNVPALYVGYGVMLGADYRWSATVGLATSASVVEGLHAPAQLSIGVLRMLSSRAGLGVTAGFGLNDSSAAFTLGASWRLRF